MSRLEIRELTEVIVGDGAWDRETLIEAVDRVAERMERGRRAAGDGRQGEPETVL